jgi:hypothetical protein
MALGSEVCQTGSPHPTPAAFGGSPSPLPYPGRSALPAHTQMGEGGGEVREGPR